MRTLIVLLWIAAFALLALPFYQATIPAAAPYQHIATIGSGLCPYWTGPCPVCGLYGNISCRWYGAREVCSCGNCGAVWRVR